MNTVSIAGRQADAGGSPYVLTAESSPKFNRKIIELNLIGALLVSQCANDEMPCASSHFCFAAERT